MTEATDHYSTHPARHWSAVEAGRLRCRLCPRGCVLGDGQVGACLNRRNVASRLVAETYGRTSGVAVDPIEKKPLYHFLPGASVLSLGGIGCNLTCGFCQNWRLSAEGSVRDLGDETSPAAVARAARRYGCAGVAFTYNEPTISLEYVIDVADACRAAGVRTVAVTNGYITHQAAEELYPRIDAANVDLKGFTPGFYAACGGKLDAVLDALLFIRHASATWLEVTTLLIPGQNDSDAELRALTAWVTERLGPDVPLHFSAFHPAYRFMDTPPTPNSTLLRARRLSHEAVVRHVYLGNTRLTEGSDTHCAGCGALLIRRRGYRADTAGLSRGRCNACGAACPGIFEA
ncbi:MAG: AmmeMemoRadiSam system radical SAM enzyme [Armatimonadetes bacterium]|nr:AmmeMemoRadiSam system radical SAM enzyme [Armatimonadota bacterium]